VVFKKLNPVSGWPPRPALEAFHFPVEAFRDAVALAEAPLADDGFVLSFLRVLASVSMSLKPLVLSVSMSPRT